MATATVILPIGAATLPDDSTGNKAAALQRKKSSAAAPSPHWFEALFDDTTEEAILFSFVVPTNYASSPVLKLFYKMASATSGTVEFEARVMCVSDGDAQDVDADAFDTANSGSATVPATAGYIDEISITLTNADGMAAGDFCVIELRRDADDATNDTATGDAEVVGARFEYTTT